MGRQVLPTFNPGLSARLYIFMIFTKCYSTVYNDHNGFASDNCARDSDFIQVKL